MDKKYQWAITIIALVIILTLSSSIRLSNWDLLTDSTTGEKIPLALDPYYFLRISETISETDSNLPDLDSMRASGFDVKWSPEIMPQFVVWIWKASSVFGEYSLQSINIFSPVLFFGIGLILFFILTYLLTKSKLTSIMACTLLAFTPAYLYRTMAGFSDHEAIGMVGFFATMIGLVFAMKYLDKSREGEYVSWNGIGLFMGILTSLTVFCWGGVATFIFMILPISFLLLWIIKLKDEENNIKDNGLIFYLTWILSSIGISTLLGFNTLDFIGRYITGSNGIISLAVLGFIIIDRIFISYGYKIKVYIKKYRIIYSACVLAVVGIITMPFIKKNFFSMGWEMLNRLLNPAWGGNRVGSTIAENAQPYLINWIGTAGNQIFWLFVAGAILIAFQFSKNIKDRKNKNILIAGFITIIFGILFSRISPTSFLNGAGIFSLSGLMYLTGVGFFIYAFLKNYFDKKIQVNSNIIILFSWLFVMLVVGRSTTRMFFVIAPFMCLLASYFTVGMWKIYKEKELEEVSKILVIGILIISLIAGGIGIYDSYNNTFSQAKTIGPSAHTQWQEAMSWVRENTDKDSIFVHWWDYGYWIQTLGERATMADGGHAQGVYDGNHKIGRYVLTTPKPETALSFFKTMDTDYLLIDQTDFGKYPAYSLIAGGNGSDELDRYSAIPIMLADDRQMYETANGVRIVFSGGMYLFEDIIYNDNGTNIFLPAQKAAVIGATISLENNILEQPQVIYLYNNIKTKIPARYVYVNGNMVDFGSGLDVVIQVIPAFNGNGINQLGAAIYLSQKVSKSLFARLYLMDDVFKEYESLELVHSEDDQIIKSMKSQGVPLSDFIYYQGFRGPIKIWDTSNIPNGIKILEEFKESPNGEFGSLDNLDFGVVKNV